MVVCFTGIFLNGIRDPTTKVWQRDVTISNAGKHLLKFCVKYHAINYIYPFSENARVVGWIHSMIEQHRTNPQSN